MGLSGVAPLPPNEARFFAAPWFPVGVRVTDGKALALVVDGPIADVMVVEPKVNGLFSLPAGGWQVEQ